MAKVTILPVKQPLNSSATEGSRLCLFDKYCGAMGERDYRAVLNRNCTGPLAKGQRPGRRNLRERQWWEKVGVLGRGLTDIR